MKTLIRFLEGWVPEDWSVIFKAHPKAKYDYPLGSSRANFHFRASGNLYDYLARADLVLGINSTVLIEAMLLGKKIAAFGQGIFNGNRLFSELAAESPFSADIPVDQERRDRFLYNLVFDRQIDLNALRMGDAAHLMTRFPFNSWGRAPEECRHRVLTINACQGKSMIKIGKSKIARTATIDVERGGVVTIGDDCEVRHHAVLETTGRYSGTIEIGNHCVVGIGNWMQGSGRIRIGNDVIIGPYVNIVSTNHMYKDVSVPVAQQPLETGEVIIEDDVWIGAGCTIVTNVRIGAHSIIGANSFVNKDVPPHSVVAGSPAKLIRKRI
jgi:acetyltransferase-like isoleucine patch superfamily enzyme